MLEQIRAIRRVTVLASVVIILMESAQLFTILVTDFYWLVDVKVLKWAYQKLRAVAFLPGEFFQDHHIISRSPMAETGSLQYQRRWDY